MRKIWKLRKIFLPQIVALLCIFATFMIGATQARAGGNIMAKTMRDKYGNEVTVKTNSTQFDVENIEASKITAVETKAANAEQTAGGPEGFKLIAEPSEFDGAIHAALSKMELTAEAIRKWIGQHPKSALKEVEMMTPAKQAKVANIATFIRSVNGKIDKKTAWREAAAIVHYCSKYNISTELAVGVAKAESTFDPSTVSKAGARGVMQVMWKYHSGMLQAKGIAATKEHLSDPERGIEAGILLLSRYVEAYGSIQKALNRYYGKVSTTYVKKIDGNVAMLEKHSSSTGF